MVYIFASGEINDKDSYDNMAHITWNESTRNSFLFEFIGILWINSFKVALTQFIIASGVCFWYFSGDRMMLGHHVLSTSTFNAFRYHLGSLAYGSLLLSIIKFIK